MIGRTILFCAATLIALANSSIAVAQNQTLADMSRWITRAEHFEKQDQHRDAADNYRQARLLAVQAFGANHTNVAALLQAEGLMRRQLGEYTQAEALITQTLTISEAGRDQELVAEAANNLAAVYWELGQYLKSLEMHEKAFGMFRQMYGEQSVTLAVSRGNLAGVYRALGQDSKAETLFLQAIAVFEKHQPKEASNLADAYMNLADVYSSRGEFSRAERLLLRSVQIKIQALGPTHFEVGRTMNNLATLYACMGQYPKAEEMHLQTVAILEKTQGPEHLDIARSLVNLAGVYQQQKKYEKAEPLYKRALAIRVAALSDDHPSVALSRHALGGLYVDTGRFAEGQELFLKSMASREAVHGKDHPTVATSLMALGNLAHLQQRYPEASERLSKALAIREARLLANHPDIAYSHYSLALLAGAEERWQQCAQHFDYARRGFRRHIGHVLPALSEEDQLTFLQVVDAENYQSALSLVVKQPEDRAIVELSANWVLNGKGIAQQTLAQRAILARDTNNPLLAAVAKSLLAVRKQLASLSLVESDNEDAAARRRRIEELTDLEQKHSSRLAQLSGRATVDQWVELAEVQKALPPKGALIEIARLKVYDYQDLLKEDLLERYVAWVIPADGAEPIKVVDLGNAAKIDEAVNAARSAYNEAPKLLQEQGESLAEAELKKVVDKLSALILKPLESQLKGREIVYLSPDSLLWLVPWNALHLEDGRYAIEAYDIRYIISGRDLIKGGATPKAGRPIMFADPNYDLNPQQIQEATARLFQSPVGRQDVLRAAPAGTFKLGTAGRLPGTKLEAEAVRPQLENWAAEPAYVYTDEWALEAVFKSIRQPRVLVLSTHGFFNVVPPDAGTRTIQTNPLLQCGMLLAGCNHPADATRTDAEDGILTGLEIVNANLHGTELVVLSACETGLGEVRIGEGVAGLRQSFQLAGAQTVIATLWKVPDRQTARLISDFFEDLAKGSEKGAALRSAQLKLIESRRERYDAAHPFFWAAFTITGA